MTVDSCHLISNTKYIVNYQLSIINYQLSIINCQLSIVNSQLSIANYQLLNKHDIVDLFLELLNKGDIKKILDYTKTKSENNFKILNCYYAMYKSLSSPENEGHYLKFKSSVSEISNLVNDFDLRYLYINLNNASITHKSNRISKDQEAVDIYNGMISKKIFNDSNNSLEANIYNNYIVAQSSLNNYEDLEKFISKFTDKLREDDRENSFNFAMARLSFLKGENKKSLEHISRINFLYFEMKYYLKNLQMMNYYELNEYEAFILAFDSYKHFTIKNKKIIEPWKIRTSAFYNTVNSFFHLRNNFDEYLFIKLKKEITGSLVFLICILTLKVNYLFLIFSEMIKNSAILILKTFSDQEVKLFEDFLVSPFHNKNTKVVQFFNGLKKYHPEYEDEGLTKENLFKELFGNSKYKESYIRNLFSDLNILAEKYLQCIHTTKEYTYEKFLMEELNERDITELLRKKISIFERKINSEKSKDQEYYLNKIFIYNMKGFLSTDKTLTQSFLPFEILDKIKILLISIMKSHFHLIIEEQRVKISHNFGLLKHTLDYLRNHLTEFKDSPLLIIYYHLWSCFFDKNDENYFLKTKKLFKTYFNSLTKLDKQNIYSVLQTYCMNKIDKGNESYNKELLNILLEMLKFNVVSHKDDLIHLNLYRNILLVCSKLKEINVLKKFISDYIGFVRVESRKSMSAYSYAHLSFHQNNFEKALELCNEINFNDLQVSTNENLFFKNDIKKLILMSLYELNSFESALSHVDSYKHFLNNSRIIKEDRRKKYLNFLNLVNELIKLKINFDDYTLVKFKKKVLRTKELVGANWILEKIDEMEPR